MPDGVTQFEFYDSLDLRKPTFPDRTRVQLELLKAVAHSTPARPTVLDLGCGDGRQTVLARDAIGAGAVVGMDWSSGALGRASRTAVPFVQGAIDGRDLPFRDGAFSTVIFSEVIEHLVDTDHAIAEIGRVLTSGGTLLISTPNLAAWFNRLLLLVGVQPVFSEVSRLRVFGRPGTQVAGHLRLFTLRALCELLRSQGFAVREVRGAAYHDLPRAARWFDRLVRRWPSLAAVLVVSAVLEATAPSG
jgi:SAM-dependent methyltransferase